MRWQARTAESRWAMMSTVRPLRDRRHIVLDDALGFIIERRGRFVEDQDLGIADQAPARWRSLALAAGEAGALLAQNCVIALRAGPG